MKLSMKSRYGLRALIDLSVNSKNEQVALGGIRSEGRRREIISLRSIWNRYLRALEKQELLRV